MPSVEKGRNRKEWYVEGYVESSKDPRRWVIRPVPFRVGRKARVDLRLPYSSVSASHAELFFRDDGLWVRDLGSLNGTFVNKTRISEPTRLHEGDVLHFSRYEFQVGYEASVVDDQDRTDTLGVSVQSLPDHFVVGARDLRRLIENRAILPLFQPIVEIKGGSVVGYEVLGRGDYQGLPSTPRTLFRIAESVGLESDLSALFRFKGVEEARSLDPDTLFFLNTHPAEIASDQLLSSLEEVRGLAPELKLVLEIHEQALTDLEQMGRLKNRLAELRIRIAYDDFGAGHARLLELADVPPDFLKFDHQLLEGIDTAPASRRELVNTLVKTVRDIGIACIAEGVENDRELETCREIDFDMVQGYLVGKPEPAGFWAVC